MIGLWSGFYKHLSLTEKSDSQVILTHERFHTSDPKASDIVRVDESGYFKIIGEPKFNDKNGNDWFEVEIGRRVKTREVRRRTRQRYQLANLRAWRDMCDSESDADDLHFIEHHIDMCLEDKNPEAALVGWVRCMENVSERRIDSMKSDLESRPKSYKAEFYQELEYRIEAETALLEWKYRELCAHAWDCDE